MYWRTIIPVFLVHTVNVKSILFSVNYMTMSNNHNRTPKSGILFTYSCIREQTRFCEALSWSHVLLLLFVRKNWTKGWYDWLRAKWSEGAEGILVERRGAPFIIHSWTIRIMCYVKVWIHIIAICSYVLRRGFLIQ